MSYYPHTGTGSTYPYGAYHPTPSAGYPHQATAAYPTAAYQTGYPTAGYTSTWPYSYSYYSPQQPHQQPSIPTSRPPAVAATPAVAPSPATTSTATAPVLQRPPTIPPTYTTYAPTHTRDPTGVGSSSRSFRKQSSYRGLFTKELRNLMYGFGDDRNPSHDSVNVLEEILVEYIVDVCQTALAPGKKARLSIEDLRKALSRPADAKKLARMEELLFMQEDIKRARAQFEESDLHAPSS